jgi:hypothetical protein
MILQRAGVVFHLNGQFVLSEKGSRGIIENSSQLGPHQMARRK